MEADHYFDLEVDLEVALEVELEGGLAVEAEVQDLELLVQLDQVVVEPVQQDVEIQELLEQLTLEAVVVVLEEDRLMVEQVVQVSWLRERRQRQEFILQRAAHVHRLRQLMEQTKLHNLKHQQI